MYFLWLDTETTGLKVENSSIFQLGMMIVNNGEVIAEKVFFLNPLISEEILYHEEAGRVHGYTEEEIRALTPEKIKIKEIVSFIEKAGGDEKPIPAGYNVGFDLKHLNALFSRNGYKLENYLNNIVADVYEQVKKAGMQKALPYLQDRKLGTICKHLNIKLDDAHDAMADIKATREVAIKLYQLGVHLL